MSDRDPKETERALKAVQTEVDGLKSQLYKAQAKLRKAWVENEIAHGRRREYTEEEKREWAQGGARKRVWKDYHHY